MRGLIFNRMKNNTSRNPKKPFVDKDINDHPSTLFVTDGKGNILISNEFTALTIGISLEELLKSNVQDLVKSGYYNRSITMEAIEEKQKVSRIVSTNRGFNVKSMAIPILDKDGEVQLVGTTSVKYNGKLPVIEINHSVLNDFGTKINELVKVEREPGIVAQSIAMKQIIKVCHKIASYDSKVLIYGESGTGKEVIAKYIHRKSDRSNGPFVAINCATIPAALFEYELFGYEKGAYSGVVEEKKGMIEAANNGYLFLDEIAEMPLDMQAKLLRVIENNELRRVGGLSNVPINCRIITATNRDLWQLVKKGHFREDLYYRINVVPIHIPPLRQRKLDIVGLISYFIEEINQSYGKRFSLRADQYEKLLKMDWPGNARELRNYVERLVVTEHTDIKLPIEEKVTDGFALDHFINSNIEKFTSLKDFTAIIEGKCINYYLDMCNGNGTEAAKKLGVDRSVIYRKLKKMEQVLNE
jgi:transcriptional regulator with PAS, ATPase and Fis domain